MGMVEALLKYSRWKKLWKKDPLCGKKIIDCVTAHTQLSWTMSIGLVKFSEKLWMVERMIGSLKELAFILWAIGNHVRFLSCEWSDQSYASGALIWQWIARRDKEGRDWEVRILVKDLLQLPRRVIMQVWLWRGRRNGK